jgi:hypothetical protein
MPVYQINGYDVDFPHEAYECQVCSFEQHRPATAVENRIVLAICLLQHVSAELHVPRGPGCCQYVGVL